MLISDNEFGAPWNDQFYEVRYITMDGDVETETMVLSGPKEYDEEELYKKAQEYFNYPLILSIWNLSIQK